MEDVVIVGGGVTGCSIARELSRYKLDITLIEKEDDVAEGTSKANSAIIHAGFDATPGTWKAKLNVKGSMLFPHLCHELDVPFKLNGSLVVAVGEEEAKNLDELFQKGIKNGVKDLSIIGRDELLKMEPNLSPNVTAALYAPTGGIVCPYELTIALAENACQNGVKFLFNAPVTNISKDEDGYFTITTPKGEVKTRFIVNAAGLFADEIAKMTGAEEYTITPRKGEYLIFDKQFGDLVSRTIFPTPSKISKGILVAPTVDGNVFIGPNSNNIEDKEDLKVTDEGIDEIVSGGKKLLPDLPMRNIIRSFAGLRAVSNTNDFIIEASKEVRGFINAGGIQSPGLSAAPAIAEMIANILAEEGLKLDIKKDFIPNRPKKYRFRELDNETRKKLIKKDPAYGHVICRCETITEAEIVDAIRRPVGARSIDAVKRRTRAGMGRCQGGFCSPRVAEILARELNIPYTEITNKGPGTEILVGQIREFLDTKGGVTE